MYAKYKQSQLIHRANLKSITLAAVRMYLVCDVNEYESKYYILLFTGHLQLEIS